ncbi:MAG: class I SAM-dependent methyltransferase [Bacteroidetes bacterium]|nr:class I SAM-dependent methyltransferase [Bacteroidota bacterium]
MNEVKEQFDNVSKKYDSQRRQLIPCFDDFYKACLPLVKSLTHAKNVLDIGAGTGLFSQFIYEANPDLRFTLVDVSSQMLDVARERFAGSDNFEFKELDFSKEPLPGKYDIIISGLAIHHLDHQDKAKLYQNIYKALNDGGLFINADQVEGKNLLFDSLYKYLWRETVSHSGLDHEALVQSFERTKLDKLAPLHTQLHMLEKAGFNEVDCIYKNLNFAVFGGYKDEKVETAVV